MRWIHLGARLVHGLIFTVFGINGLFALSGASAPIPVPPMPAEANAFLGALIGSGYAFWLVKLVETAAGILLLIDRFTPLATAVLSPIVLHIFLFHIFLAPAGLPVAIILLLSQAWLFYAYRNIFRNLLEARALPT